MINLHSEVGGWFRIEAVRPDGTRRLLADWFPNLILNQGLDMLGALSSETSGHMTACQVGSSNTAPANTQTALLAYVAGTATITESNSGFESTPPYYGWARRTYRFGQGVAAGNLSEVGVGRTTSGNTLFSRALILDGEGDPTTITVLSDEFLDVTYELRQYPATVDVTGSLIISGVDYDYVVRAMLVTSGNWTRAADPFDVVFASYNTYTGPLGPITGNPAGQAAGNGSVTYLSYTPGNYYRDTKIVWSIADGNASGGVGAIGYTTGRGAFQVSFDPPIPKDATKILEIVMRTSWARKTL